MSKAATVRQRRKSIEPSPFDRIKDIYDAISKKVIGQDQAKRVVAMAVALHWDRVQNQIKVAKSNVLLYGPTGSGKTEIARAIANELNCPFIIVDCSKVTPTGFTGDDPTTFLFELFDQCGGDLQRTESAIVFLDEIDKLCVQDYSTEGAFQSRKVMAELLKLIEGQCIQLKKKTLIPGMEQVVNIDTSNMLFIGAGAFAGIEDYFTSQKKHRTLGIAQPPEELTEAAPPQGEFVKALFQYGMMPELAGRFQLMAKTQSLSKEDYIQIISNVGFSHTTNYYGQLLAKENTLLELSPSLTMSLAEQAVFLGLGARGVQGLIEQRMVELVFSIDEIRGKRVTLDIDGFSVEGKGGAKKTSTSMVALLQKQSILSGVDNAGLVDFCSAGRLLEYKAGDVIMKEGEPPKSVMILISGVLRATNETGLNVIRDEIGSSFGEISFLEGKSRTATLTAETDSKVLEFNSEELRRLISTRPDLGVKVLQAFSKVAFERIKR